MAAARRIVIGHLWRHSTKSAVSISIPNSKSFSKAPAIYRQDLIPVFRRYGFPPSEIPNFLNKNEFLQTPRPEEIEKSLEILSSLLPSRDFLVSTVIGCPSVLRLHLLEKWELGISKFGISYFTPLAIRNVLEFSMKFRLTPDDVCRSVWCLKHFGFSNCTIIRVLEIVPMVIILKEDQIQDKIEFLIGIGVQKIEMDRVFRLFPEIMSFAVEDRLRPLIEEFRDLGFSLNEIRAEVARDPKVLGLENGELSQCLEMLRSLRCRWAIKDDIYRDGEFRAGYKVKLRVDCLRKYGLTYRDAFTVLWKEPRVVLYKIEDIEKKIEFLVDKMKFDVGCLVEVPEYLGVSFDKQIVARFNVVEYLRSRGGLGDEVGLRNLVKLSRLRFYNLYVKPYPECEKMYGRYDGGGAVRNRHRVGMWKLFLPQKHAMSIQDEQNMKSYMKSLP